MWFSQLDITVGEMKLDDQFEWDLENEDATPEQFAEVYSNDLGLAGEFKYVYHQKYWMGYQIY